MAFGNTRKRRTGKGVYAGSGNAPGSTVSVGGTHARSGVVHNGMGGAGGGGGATTGGSQPVAGAFTYKGKDYFRNKQGNLAALTGKYTGNRISAAAGLKGIKAGTRLPGTVAPSPGGPLQRPAAQPGQPAPPDFTIWQDSQYGDDLRGVRNQYNAELNPILSELEGLQSTKFGGQTLYDSLYGRAQRDFTQNALSARDDASKRGLLVSGNFDRTRTGLADDFTGRQRELYSKYGEGRLAALRSQRDRLLGQQELDLGNLQRSASARGLEWWNQSLNNQYQGLQAASPQDPFYGFGLS